MDDNPLADHEHYRALIIDICGKLERLDRTPVNSLFKRQTDETDEKAAKSKWKMTNQQIDELIDQTVSEYNDRLKREREYKNHIIDLLDKRRREVEEIFREYEEGMNSELSESLKYLQALGTSKDLSVNQSYDEMERWKIKLKELEDEKVKTVARMEESLGKIKQDNMSVSNLLAFGTNLYEISLKRPSLYRSIKVTAQFTRHLHHFGIRKVLLKLVTISWAAGKRV